MALNYKKLNSKMVNLIMIGFAIVLVVIAKNSCKDFFSNIELSNNSTDEQSNIGKMGFAQIARNNYYIDLFQNNCIKDINYLLINIWER